MHEKLDFLPINTIYLEKHIREKVVLCSDRKRHSESNKKNVFRSVKKNNGKGKLIDQETVIDRYEEVLNYIE